VKLPWIDGYLARKDLTKTVATFAEIVVEVKEWKWGSKVRDNNWERKVLRNALEVFFFILFFLFGINILDR